MDDVCNTPESIIGSKAPFLRSLTSTQLHIMNNINPPADVNPAPDEPGDFYDSIHGRSSLHDLPDKFHPALKAALARPTLNRLRRISQLGHTSVSFFSATQTRFSHAIGTKLLMNKLYRHVRSRS